MLLALPYLVVIFVAFAGFVLTVYIHHKKRRPKEAMVCPLGHDCSNVIQSEYSKFLGVPIELAGMAYYALIALTYGLFILVPELAQSLLGMAAFFATLGAFLFSLYLTFIQAFTLKQWCTWCLSSAGLCTIIFFFSLLAVQTQLLVFLVEFRELFVVLHVFGFAIGLGAATLADVFFFRFLKDLRISHREAAMLRIFSQFIWLALALLFLTGTALFLTDPVRLAASSKFLVKLVVVGVILANGAFLNLYITPKLVHISFGDPHEHHEGELRHDRRLSFASGAISFVSWYTAFILGNLRSVPLSFWQLLGIYVAVLVAAVVGSQLVERLIARRGWGQPIPE